MAEDNKSPQQETAITETAQNSCVAAQEAGTAMTTASIVAQEAGSAATASIVAQEAGVAEPAPSIADRVQAWINLLSAKNPQEQLVEVAQAYANMLLAAEMVVQAEEKIAGFQRYLMVLARRNGDYIMISDEEIEDLEGVFRIKRSPDDKGTTFSIRPSEGLPS